MDLLSKTTKDSQESRTPGRHLNPEIPGHKCYRIWKKAVMTYLNKLSRHLASDNDKTHNKPQSVILFSQLIYNRIPPKFKYRRWHDNIKIDLKVALRQTYFILI
jgi:hypothetical protein